MATLAGGDLQRVGGPSEGWREEDSKDIVVHCEHYHFFISFCVYVLDMMLHGTRTKITGKKEMAKVTRVGVCGSCDWLTGRRSAKRADKKSSQRKEKSYYCLLVLTEARLARITVGNIVMIRTPTSETGRVGRAGRTVMGEHDMLRAVSSVRPNVPWACPSHLMSGPLGWEELKGLTAR